MTDESPRDLQRLRGPRMLSLKTAESLKRSLPIPAYSEPWPAHGKMNGVLDRAQLGVNLTMTSARSCCARYSIARATYPVLKVTS